MEGERGGFGILEQCLQCAILAHIHLVASNVNQQSLPWNRLFYPPLINGLAGKPLTRP